MNRLRFLETLAPNSIPMYRSHYGNFFRLIYKLNAEEQISGYFPEYQMKTTRFNPKNNPSQPKSGQNRFDAVNK